MLIYLILLAILQEEILNVPILKMRKLSLGENLSGIINHKRLSNWDWIIKILTKAQ